MQAKVAKEYMTNTSAIDKILCKLAITTSAVLMITAWAKLADFGTGYKLILVTLLQDTIKLYLCRKNCQKPPVGVASPLFSIW